MSNFATNTIFADTFSWFAASLSVQFERFRRIFIQLGKFDMLKKMRENLILGHFLKDYKEYLLFCYIYLVVSKNTLLE